MRKVSREMKVGILSIRTPLFGGNSMKTLLPKLGLLQREILDRSMEEKGASGLNEKEEDLFECSYIHICILKQMHTLYTTSFDP